MSYADYPKGATSSSSLAGAGAGGYNNQHHSEYPPYKNTAAASFTTSASHDQFTSPDASSQRGILRDSYPPGSSSEIGEKYGNGVTGGGEDYGYEKSLNPVTRGSIAAQMAAEGQIPKKEGLRMWRTDEHMGAFMKGGRGKCCGRVCLCSLVLVLVILISVITAFLLWTRPPDITFNGVEAPLTGTEVGVQKNGFLLNFGLNIGVLNPNFFGVSFQRIAAVATYSTAPNIPFGGGALNDVNILKMSNTTIHFPFTINYTTTIDPSLSILKDIAKRCGYLNSTTVQPLVVDYTITLTLKVVSVVLNPSFSSSASIPCPLTQSDINSLLGPGGLTSLNSSSTAKVTKREELGFESQTLVNQVMGDSLERAIEGPWVRTTLW